MFQNKKTILIAASGLLVIVLAVGIFFYLKNKNSGTVVINNLPTTTGSGVAQQGQNFSTSQITIHQDATQPFALALPRQTPTQSLQNITNGNSGSPGSNNQNPQAANSVGIDPADITNPDYQLADSSFLNKYYTDASQVINVDSPGYQQAQASDPVITTNTSTASGSLNLATNPNYDPAQFKVSSDNSTAAVINYVQNMSSVTGSFDLVNNPGYLHTILSNPTPTMIASDISKSNAIISQIKNTSVPSSALGMSENYTAVYSDYTQLLTDLNQVGATTTTTVNGHQVQTPVDSSNLSGQIQLDANNLSADISVVNSNISSISSYFQSQQ